MKLRKSIILLLSAMLTAGCGSSSETAKEDKPSEPQEEKQESSNSDQQVTPQKQVSPADVTFEDYQIGNALFPIPTNWKISEEEGTINFYPPESNDMIFVSYNDIGFSLDGREEEVFSGVRSSFEEDEIVWSEEDSTFGGRAAKLFTADIEAASGRIFKTSAYAFCYDSCMYIMEFAIDDTNAVSYRPIYSYIISNTKFNSEVSSTPAAEPEPKKEEQQPAQTETVSKEYQAALKSAQSYNSFMHMSKQGLYDQLTSEYGDGFPADAAQYAVDHIQADWNENALKSAESYADIMHMSKSAIYDQLISEYGDKFEPEQAQYAVDHVQADWNKNALESAKSYREYMSMSSSAIYDQLVSEYGDQFEPDQAQYAIDHMDE